MITRTKAELINEVATQAGITLAQAKRAVNAVTQNLIDSVVRNGRFALPGVGVFCRVVRAPRTGRNPQTGAAIDIPGKYAVKFKMAAELKGAVNQ